LRNCAEVRDELDDELEDDVVVAVDAVAVVPETVMASSGVLRRGVRRNALAGEVVDCPSPMKRAARRIQARNHVRGIV